MLENFYPEKYYLGNFLSCILFILKFFYLVIFLFWRNLPWKSFILKKFILENFHPQKIYPSKFYLNIIFIIWSSIFGRAHIWSNPYLVQPIFGRGHIWSNQIWSVPYLIQPVLVGVIFGPSKFGLFFLRYLAHT